MSGLGRRRGPIARAAFLAATPLHLARLAAPATANWRHLSATSLRASALVVVESPAKAKTIQRILPEDEYTVRSCVGHVRELPSSAKRIPAKFKNEPWSRLGVDVENGFRPIYVLIAGKQKVVRELQAALKEADELILATDGDREGEAISWHLVEVLKPKVPVKRAVFHEITAEAIAGGVANGRGIDLKLVEAQETRRILDRLAGYTMSPLLWKKIAMKLSAGRVQSVALSLIVKRELERLRFRAAEFCDATARFGEVVNAGDGDGADNGHALEATLVAVDSNRVARGGDFDAEKGALSEAACAKGVVVLSKEDVAELLDAVSGGEIVSVQKTRASKTPPKPFITSTLQQEGGNKLGMSAGRVMRIAQSLYENGHITYMRTDNAELSEQAVAAARVAVEERYGKDHVRSTEGGGDGGRRKSKKTKNAKTVQGAHEAIRPAGVEFKKPENIGLEDSDELKVYSLIYRRTLASQMADAAFDTTSIDIKCSLAGSKRGWEEAGFRANGRVMVFSGFLRAYEEFEDSSSGGGGGASVSVVSLPDVAEGTRLQYCSSEILEHKTKPKARYTDASLVKELEVQGVGRPSTYASIIEKLVERTYIFRGNQLSSEKPGVSPRHLVPSLTAFAVDRLLSQHFPSFVDAGFTAKMEEALDTIASGEGEGTAYLSQYFLGDDGLAATVTKTEKDIDNYAFRRVSLPNRPARDVSPDEEAESGAGREKARKAAKKKRGKAAADSPAEEGSEKEVVDWRKVDILVGPHGPYLEYRGRAIASLPRTTLANEVSDNLIQGLVELAKDPVIGEDPENGVPILVKTSGYGPYVQYGRDEDVEEGEKPPRQGLLPGMDVGDLTVDLALKLLSLPRLLGHHPETGMEVRAGTGRYGDYVVHEGQEAKYATLKKREHDVLEIELDEALSLLKEVEERRQKREAAAAAKAAAALESGEPSKGDRKSRTSTSSTAKKTVSKSPAKRASKTGSSTRSASTKATSKSSEKKKTVAVKAKVRKAQN